MRKKTFFLKGITTLALSIATFFSCTVDEELNTEEFSSTNESFAVTAGAKYYLKGSNGKYVSHNNAAKDMKCDRTNPAAWEQFYLRQGSGYWYIKAVSINRYVSSENGAKDMICNRTALGAWEKFDILYHGTSNGNDVVAFRSRSNNRYVSSENGSKDMTCNRTAVGAWEKFELVPVDGSNPPTVDPPTGGGDTPGGVLGIDNGDWKLNGFTATPSASATYYDDVMDQVNGNISTWSNSNYFYELDGWAVFECYRGLGTSKNSENPRTELRELDGNGNQASWRNEENNSMQFTFRVDQLSNDVDNEDGVVSIGQIHGPSGNSNVDDIVRVQFHGDAGQKSGDVRIKISGDVADANGGSRFYEGFKLDTSYVMKIQYKSDDSVIVSINGSELYNEKMDHDEDGNYFKVGCYLQESKGASFDGSSAIVRVKNLSIF